MKQLYKIQGDILRLIQRMDETDDPIENSSLMRQLSELEIDKDIKLEGCCAYVKQLRAEIETVVGEIMRLRKLMDQLENRQEAFLEYMKFCLPANESWKKGVHSITWRRSDAIEVYDESKIPIQYLREKLVYEPDRVQAKQDIKMGAEVPGMKLITKQNIQVK